MSDNKTNLIIAVRGYKILKKEKNATFTDVTAIDSCNNKVLLRIVEPLTIGYIDVNAVKNMAKVIKSDGYSSAVLVSKHFTDSALKEMSEQKIQHISQDYMPPFDIQELYLAVVNCANTQCEKKCGKILTVISECKEKAADKCKTKALVLTAKYHFEEGIVGLLKNDLIVALATTR